MDAYPPRPIQRYLTVVLFVLLAACASPGVPPAGAPVDTARSSRSSSVINPSPGQSGAALTPPTVEVDDNRALGSRDARIAIIEFADYQCPYCRTFHVGTLPDIKRAYIDTGAVRYFYKDFPLRMHPEAMGASIAAYCAGAQGRYWPMQDRLYAEQGRLGAALYRELARELALDAERFDACAKSRSAARAVNRDLSEGRRLGINATPTFLLGRIEDGRIVVKGVARGAVTFETFAREIDALLKR